MGCFMKLLAPLKLTRSLSDFYGQLLYEIDLVSKQLV